MTRFRQDERGGVVNLAAVLMATLFGVGALAVDLSNSYATRAKLQAAADAAALAAAQQLPDTAAATTAALDLAGKNARPSDGTIMKASDVVFGTYDPATQSFVAGGSNPNAARVVAGRTAANGNEARTFLASIWGTSSTGIQAGATAYRASSGPAYCVIVLDGSAVSALEVKGGGKFSVPNCGVYVNSGHNKAASSGNATSVLAKNFCIVGGYNGSFSPTPTTGCASMPDPLAAVPEPTMPAVACAPSANPQPNTCYYTGAITVSSSTALASGTYFFKNATVTIAAGANITGTNVMWYFDANSTLDFASNGTVHLTAPSSGAWRGIAMFQSRSAPLNNTMKITGSADFILDGTVYMPRAQLQLTGNSDVSVNSKSGYVIANKLAFTGSSTFTVGTWGGVQALGSMTPPNLVQ